MMDKTVIILGAGASKDTGAPLMSEFLDVSERLLKNNKTGNRENHFELVFKAIAELQKAHSKSELDTDNLESVFSTFEMATLIGRLGDLDADEISNLSSAIRQLIVGTLENSIKYPFHGATISPTKSYQELADFIYTFSRCGFQNTSILTFNYDIALDFAFFKKGVPIDYCLAPSIPNDDLKLLKLHGSLNWGRRQDNNSVVAWDFRNYFSQFRFPPQETSVTEVTLEIVNKFGSYNQGGAKIVPDPVIVPPTWSKGSYYKEIQNVWSHAAFALSEAETIFIIGYSLPETDQFFRYLYALGSISETRIKKIQVFNIDPAVDKRFKNLLGATTKKRYEFIPKTFNDSLSYLRSHYQRGNA